MRITDHRIVDLNAAATQRNQSRVADLAEQVSTGLRVRKPSEDPTAWMTAQRERVRSALNDGTAQAIETSHERLTATDGALSQLSSIVEQVRALTVQGASGTQNASGRAAIGQEVDALFSAAVAAANSKDANGEYILAGAMSLAQPFDTITGSYIGDANARSVATDPTTNQLATVAGSQLTATNGVDVLPLLKRIATAMSTNDVATAQSALADLDTATKQLAQTRSHTGGMMAVLDSAKSAHAALSEHLATSIADAVETDTVAAASELAKASQALQVSQTVSAHVLQLLDPTK